MSLHSMTGFGRGEASKAGVNVVCEAKSVNHRFLDVALRLPTVYGQFEADAVALIKKLLERGRVELTISRADRAKSAYDVTFDKSLFRQALNAVEAGLRDEKFSRDSAAHAAALTVLFQRREILDFSASEKKVDTERTLLLRAVEMAIKNLITMRRREGTALEKDLQGRLKELEQLSKSMAKLVVQTPDQYRKRLEERLAKMEADNRVDAARLAQEVAIFADRVDTSEELTRLASHVSQFRDLLKQGAVGRKMEFLLQEMGREVNTTGSKVQNSEVSYLVVEAKAVLEKMREQAQNVE